MKLVTTIAIILGAVLAQASTERTVTALISCEQKDVVKRMEFSVVKDPKSMTGLSLLLLTVNGRTGGLALVGKKTVSEFVRNQVAVYRDPSQTTYFLVTRTSNSVVGDLTTQLSGTTPLKFQNMNCVYDSEVTFQE